MGFNMDLGISFVCKIVIPIDGFASSSQKARQELEAIYRIVGNGLT